MVLRIPVFVELEPDRISDAHHVPGFEICYDEEDVKARLKMLVERGLRARLEAQSMVTGQLVVAFDIHEDKPIKLIGIQPEFPELPTIPSGMEEFKQLPIHQIVNELLAAIQGIESIINSPEMTGSLSSLNQTMDELKDLVRKVNEKISPLGTRVDEIMTDSQTLINKIDDKITPLVETIDQVLIDTQKLVRNVDEQVKPMASNVNDTLQDARKLVQNVEGRVEPITAGIEEASRTAAEALKQVNETISKLNGLTPKDSALIYEITNTLKTLSEAMESLRTMADYLERHPEALLKGKSGS